MVSPAQAIAAVKMMESREAIALVKISTGEYRTALVCIVLLAAGCARTNPPEKTYALRGVIVGLNPQIKTATIRHEKIGDWMEAMTMEFPVKDPAEFAKLQVGQKITATVHVRPETFAYWIANIHTEGP